MAGKYKDTSPLAMGRQQRGSAANKKKKKDEEKAAVKKTAKPSSITQKERINQKSYGTTTPKVTTKTTTAPKKTTQKTTTQNNKITQQQRINQKSYGDKNGLQTKQTTQTTQKRHTSTSERRKNAEANNNLKQTVARQRREERAANSKEMMERRKAAQEQKSGTNAINRPSEATKTAANRAVKNTPTVVKKAVKDTIGGHKKTIADVTDMTAEKGTNAYAMKLGVDTNDKKAMEKVKADRKKTAAEARRIFEEEQKKQDKRQAEWDEKSKDAKGLEKAYYGAVESGTGMLTDMALGMGTQAGALAAMGSRTYGSTRGQAMKEGATLAEDRRYALLQAGKEVSTELMFPGAGLAKKAYGRAGASLGEKAASLLLKNLKGPAAETASSGVRLLGGVLEENAEEVAGWGLDPIIKEYTYGKNVRTREAKSAMKERSDALRANIQNEDDMRAAAAYISSGDFIEQTKQSYIEAGLSEQDASEIADRMRDYLQASLTGDIDTMAEIEDEVSKKVAGTQKMTWDFGELKDTIASTTLLTAATGLPGTVKTSAQGAAIKESLGYDGVNALAKTAVDFEDPDVSRKAKAMQERIESGKELTNTQVYDLQVAMNEQVKVDTQREKSARNMAGRVIEEENLVSPVTVDRNGSIHLDEVTAKTYTEEAKQAENIIKALESEGKESLTDTERADGGRAIAGFQTGVFTINDANTLNYSNTTVRAAFQEATGVNLDQYIVRNSDGSVNIPATNTATKDALFAMAADNLVKSAQAETVNWMDNTKGQVVTQVSARMGAEGNAVLQQALDDVDERDRSKYMLTANATDMLYQAARNMGAPWSDVVSEVTKMFPGIPESKLQMMYEAGLADRDMARDTMRNRQIMIGESISEVGEQDPVTGDVFIETAEPPKGSVIRTFTEIAQNLGVDIHLVDSLGVGEEGKQANGQYIDGAIYINVNSGVEKNIGYIFMHEVTHHLRQYAPEQYQALEDLVRENWFAYNPSQMQEAIAKKIASYAKYGQELSEDDALEEIIADAAHEFINDPNFAEQVAEEDPSLAKAILNSIRDALRKLRQIFATNAIEDETYMNSLFSELGILDEAEKLWLDAYKQAVDNRAAVGMVKWHEDILTGRLSIKEGMTDEERYQDLKNKPLTVIESNVSDLDLTDEELESLKARKLGEARDAAVKLARALGVKDVYSNEDIDFEFEYTYGGLDESAQKQAAVKGDDKYVNFVNLMANLRPVIENAYLIKKYDDTEYLRENPGHKPNDNLKFTYVLVSAFSDTANIVPVKLTVMEYFEHTSPKLHVAMTTSEIKKTRIIADRHNTPLQGVSGASATSFEISLSDFLPEINDEELEKYIPVQFYTEDESSTSDNYNEDYANEIEAADARYSIVEDPETIRQLEADDHTTTYRAMALIDGKLYPPMATKVKDEKGKWTLQQGINLGQWVESDITTDSRMFDKDGKFHLKKDDGSDVYAAYNPYIHSSDSMLNDQFATAYKRPNIVVVEGEIPDSELISGYRAEHDLDDGRHVTAKDTTGITDWKAGVVQGQLSGKRTVYLTNHFKPTRIVPDSEVAEHIRDKVAGTDIAIPYNVVTPSVREELLKQGVKMEQSKEEKYKVKFSLDEPVERVKDLIAVHNLKPDDIRNTFELGGFPMPSIAVTKDSMGHDMYGDITLMFHSDTIDPGKRKANQVFGGDAYTPVFPSIRYKPNDEVSRKISDLYYDNAKDVGYDGMRGLYRYAEGIEDELNSAGGEKELIEKAKSDTALMSTFLKINNMDVENIYKRTEIKMSEYEVERCEHFIEALGEEKLREYEGADIPHGREMIEHRRTWMQDNLDAVKEAYSDYLRKYFEFTDEDIQNELNNSKMLKFSTFVRDALNYLNNGDTTVKEELDISATNEAVKEKAVSNGFEAWVEDLLTGVEEKKGIRNNKDFFTNMGQRRKWEVLHDPVTLDNVVKVMKSNLDAGANGLFGANPKGAAQKRYRNLSEIRADEDRLQMLPEEDYKRLSEEALDKLTEVCGSIYDHNASKFSNTFGGVLDVGEAIAEILNETRTKAGIQRILTKEYQWRVSDLEMDDLMEAIDAIANVPTGYFEAKPKRAVTFDEVKAAIIPQSTDEDIKTGLADRGVPMYEYDPEVEGDRTERVNQAASEQKLRFSLTDSEGTELSEGQQTFFSRSKNRDAEGQLKVMLHGTNKEFYEFDPTKAKPGTLGRAFYFSDSASHAGQYGKAYKYYLNLENPLVAGTHNITKDQLRSFVAALAEDEDYGIENYGYDATVDSVTDSVWGGTDFAMLQDLNLTSVGDFAEALKFFNRVNGTDYDGIITDIETAAFYPEQIKSIYNLNPTLSKDTRYSIADEDEALSQLAYEDAVDNSYEALEYYERLYDMSEQEVDMYLSEPQDEESMNEFYAALNSEENVPFTEPELEEGRVRIAASRSDFYNSINARWRETWTTGGEVLDIKSVERQIRDLVKAAMANSNTDAKYRQQTVNRTLIDVREAYQLMKQDRSDIASSLLYHSAQNMISNLEFIQDDEAFEEYKEIRRFLHSYKITLDDRFWNNETFLEFRKSHFGTLRLAKGLRSDVDKIYQELEERFPAVFNESARENLGLGEAEEDLLEHIGYVVDQNVKPFMVAYSSEEATELTFSIAEQLYDIMESGRPIESLGDQLDSKGIRRLEGIYQDMENAEERHQSETQALRSEYDERISSMKRDHASDIDMLEYQTQMMKVRHEEALQKLAERKDQQAEKKIQKLKEKQKEKEAKRKEKQEHKKRFESINKTYNKLVERLLSNTKDSNIPEQYKKELAKLLAAFDLQTELSKKIEATKGQKAKKTIKMAAIRTALNNIEKKSDLFHVNDAVTDIMDELQSIEGQTIDALSAAELEKIDKMLKSLLHEFNHYRKVKVGMKNLQAADLANAQVKSALEHAATFGPGNDYQNMLGWMDKIINLDEMTPAYMFKRIDPDNTGLGLMWKEIKRSHDKYIRNTAKITEWMNEIIGEYHNRGRFSKKYGADKIEEWRSSNYTQTFNLQNGTIKLTPAQMMSLYCLSKRNQAYGHMVGAGVVVAPVNFQSKMMTDLKRKTNRALPIILTDADIKTVVQALTPEQVKVADKLQQLMVNQMADWGNEASMNVLGIKLFTEEDYFPIKSDRAALEKDLTSEQFENAIRNFGFTKAVQPGARNAIMIDDIFDVVTEHCNNMNLYNAYSETLNDFMKVYNKHSIQEDGADYSVAQAISHAYSQKATTFIMEFIRDLNGNVSKGRNTGINEAMNTALARAKQASVFANIRVLLQQPTAITRAFAVINPKYLKAVKVEKGVMDEMWEHCPIALWKSWGYYDINMGKTIEDVIMNNGNWLEDAATQAYGAADNVTWAAIWQMVKAETKDTHKNVKEESDEFWDLCNERMSEIVDLTQVVDSPLHRSHAMRDKAFHVKLATSFMAEPTLTFNMIRDGYVRAREAWVKGDKAKASAILSKTASVALLQAATVASAAAIADAIRGKGADDGEDKDFLALWWANTLANFKDEMKIWNKVYYIKDLASIAEGWDNANLALQGWKSLWDGIRQADKKLFEGSKTPWWKIYSNLLGGIGYFTGIPFKTLMKDGRAVFEMLGGRLPDSLVGEQKTDGVISSGSVLQNMRLLKTSDTKEDTGTVAKVDAADKWYDYGNIPITVKDGSALDKVLNHFGINLTKAEKAAAVADQKRKEMDQKAEEIGNKYAGLSGEERDKKIWSAVTTYTKSNDEEGRSFADMVQAGDYESIEEMKRMYKAAGGESEYFDNRVMSESKKAFKKTIKYDPTQEEIDAQEHIRDYMLLNGMSYEELSDMAYKSDTAKDMKIAFRINDKDAMMETLVPLVRAGLSYDDLERLWDNRNRIQISSYNGRYKDRLKSTGTYNWPVTGTITSGFGYRSAGSTNGVGSTNHKGLDIGASMGTPVGASDGGTVIFAGWDGGYGKCVRIQHDDGTITEYAHLSWWDAKVGDTVAQGQTIGNVGSTGNSTGPHLHFGVKKNGSYVDPTGYLN